MIDKETPTGNLTILTALAREADALIRRKRFIKDDELDQVRQQKIKNGNATVLQCGIGRDVLCATAEPHLHDSTIVGNIGVSGGLAPDLTPGMLILADNIIISEDNDSTYRKSYLPNQHITDIIEIVIKKNKLQYRRGTVLCNKSPMTLPEKKAAAHLETKALSVDMESAGAAEAARRAALPFFCVKVICDPADRKIEKVLLNAVDSHGYNRPTRLVLPLIKHPWLTPHLLQMALDFNLACKSIRQFWGVAQNPLIDFANEVSAARTFNTKQKSF